VTATTLVVACLLLIPAQPGGAAPAKQVKPPPPGRAEQAKFRRDFGLDSSAQAMDRAQVSPASRRPVDFGVPLTQAEEDDLAHRADLQSKRNSLDAVADRYADETGGVSIDQLAKGQFVVLVRPSLTEAHRAELVGAVPAGGSVRFDPAAASTTQMRAAVDALNDSFGRWADKHASAPLDRLWDDLRAQGIDVTGYWPDPATGALTVMARAIDEQHAAAGRSAWDRDGTSLLPTSAVSFVAGEAGPGLDTRFDSPGQLKAGTELDYNNGYYCTANMAATNGAGLHQITAGHCGGKCTTGTAMYHGGTYVGYVSANAFCGTTTNADAELILTQPGGYASPYLMGVPASQNPQIWPIPAVSNPLPGDSTCLDGVASYWSKCGKVLATNATVTTPEGPTLTGQSTTTVLAVSGDSGGPLSWGGIVNGVISRNLLNNSAGVFTPIGNVLSRYSLTSLLTQGPGYPGNWALLVVRYSGMCADVQWNALGNGTPLWQWTCNGNPAQQWSLVPNFNTDGAGNIIYSIERFPFPSKCMDYDRNAGTINNGAKIQEWDCNGWDNQKWRLHRSYDDASHANFEVINLFSGKCLDMNIATGGGHPGDNLQGWQCLGHYGYDQTNQNWRIG
jgi:Ricin-type beta-trefoil lectin domain